MLSGRDLPLFLATLVVQAPRAARAAMIPKSLRVEARVAGMAFLGMSGEARPDDGAIGAGAWP